MERLIAHGGDALLDCELMNYTLGPVLTCNPSSTTDALIERFGSFAHTLAAPAEQLEDAGLPRSAIATLKSVQAAAARLARCEARREPVLHNYQALLDYLKVRLAREQIEQFLVVFLDVRNRVLADEVQARGTVNHVAVYPREVVRRALELNATALILVHNHPSGNPTPSRDDIELTAQVVAAADVFQIQVHDHLVVGSEAVLSFRSEGLLQSRYSAPPEPTGIARKDRESSIVGVSLDGSEPLA